MPWTIATNNSEILAIHAALLPTNQILMFGGSEHNAAQNESGNPADLDNSRLFNLSGATLIETIGSPGRGGLTTRLGTTMRSSTPSRARSREFSTTVLARSRGSCSGRARASTRSSRANGESRTSC